MIVYTDSIDYAQRILVTPTAFKEISTLSLTDDLRRLLDHLYGTNAVYQSEIEPIGLWNNLFIVKRAPESHYDLVADFARENKPIPDRSLFMADSGDRFHGFKGRSWAGMSGNIHLVAYIEPRRPIDHIGVAFTVLAAVSVAQTVDTIENLEGKAGIKWVNDILLNDAKIAGVLAFSQAEGLNITAAAIGVGLNVETSPEIPPSDFVPVAGSIRQFESEAKMSGLAFVFHNLLDKLNKNIKILYSGRYRELLEIYRQRSVIIGREVSIRLDTDNSETKEICSGRVLSIGKDLQLHLEGVPNPVLIGRLVMLS